MLDPRVDGVLVQFAMAACNNSRWEDQIVGAIVSWDGDGANGGFVVFDGLNGCV